MKPKDSLSSFIEERLLFELSPHYDDINVVNLAEYLADSLKMYNYCEEPYFAYERALECPINKCREKECRACNCNSYDFCRLLRREGYII